MDGPHPQPPARIPRPPLRNVLVWGAAAGLALAAHAAVALLALRPAPDLPPGPPGAPAVLIDLAPLPISAATDRDQFSPDPIDAPDIPDLSEPETLPAPALESAMALPPAPQTPTPPDLAAAPSLPPPPDPAPPPRPAPRPVERAQRPPPDPAKPAKSQEPPSRAATAARIRAARPAETAAAPAGGGGETASQTSRWKAQVMARLAARMVYPSEERAAGRGGTAVVQIDLAPDGVVRRARLLKSSGNRAVDAAALSAVRMASPLPKPPPGAPLELTAPFTFDP